MDTHVCKQCGLHFVYCRQCVFKPIPYKDAGFCSKECYKASKNVIEEVFQTAEEPIVEQILLADDIESKEIIEVEEPINEIPTIEEIIVEEDTSSFSTKECMSDEDTETALYE